jgi:hypothetical protein
MKLSLVLFIGYLFFLVAGYNTWGIPVLIPVSEFNTVVNLNMFGFWAGLFHGVTIGISFIGSIFSDSISIYAVNNDGFSYNTGFFVGFLYIILMIKLRQLK